MATPDIAKTPEPVVHIRKILHPTDFSAPSTRALAYAKRLAEHFNAALTILHVMPTVYAPGRYAEVDYFEAHLSTRQEAEEKLKAMADEEIIKEMILAEGRPDDEIVRIARESDTDLIVISTHGTTGIKHLLMGSTAEKVVRHAACPVLVVKENEHDFISFD